MLAPSRDPWVLLAPSSDPWVLLAPSRDSWEANASVPCHCDPMALLTLLSLALASLAAGSLLTVGISMLFYR